MHKIVSIFFYFVFTEWPSALAVPTLSTDAEKAIADLTTLDEIQWENTLTTDDLKFLCYDLMLNYEKIEKFFKDKQNFPMNITSKYVADVKKEVMILECTSTEDYNYWFTAGANLMYVRIKKENAEYIPDQLINTKLVDQWEYVHYMDYTKTFCQKIFAAHHPQYSAVHALRAIRNGLDINFDPTMFMTLLCYYDSNNYIEYCEGQEDNQVSEVTYLGENVYMPKENSSIYVYY